MKKRIVIITMIICTACLLLWRFLPRSFAGIVPVDAKSVISISAGAMVDRFEDGQFSKDTYRIDILQPQVDSIEEIFKILDTTEYRQDYRNILPWQMDYVDGGKDYDGYIVTLQIVLGDEYISIQFLSHSSMLISTGKSDFHIYHPTNPQTLYDLVEFIYLHTFPNQISPV